MNRHHLLRKENKLLTTSIVFKYPYKDIYFGLRKLVLETGIKNKIQLLLESHNAVYVFTEVHKKFSSKTENFNQMLESNTK